jgi:hypothetical protein
VLLGSKAYVADRTNQVPGDVLGVIVLDMVGFNPRAADSLNVLTNLTSEWLADLVQESEAVLDGANGLDELDKVVRQTLGYSDHFPVWGEGASAVLLIENVDIDQLTPNYHRTSDTVAALTATEGFDLMRRTAEVVVATLGQFASPPPEAGFVVSGSSLSFYDEAGRYAVDLVVGETIEARTRVLNAGPAREGALPVHAALELGGAVVAERDTTFQGWGSGVWRDVPVRWRPAPADAGSHSLTARITIRAGGVPLATLTERAPLEVAPLAVREIYIAPNPVRGSLANAVLRLDDLTGGADLRCLVLDAAGGEVGRSERRVEGRITSIPLSELAGTETVPSGVYLLRAEARVPGDGGVVFDEELPFAVVR